ncbi:LLM class flavin-dependent oxidoreductase [Tropicibacter sp. R16_0]|uniref:MupA/Atu3671 family FMN-dependent luciferase-like monooxygenase n=1 Tax=Tropicibacter sp. R16_0 TaxID=2821102 RepID=UPI001ADCFDB1|nr:MupA/Atu3671 family FMN-dependent luciferase-like monooxygenase [Tropicibacter sp. R16_0]MBO9451653.1 LLM class flavin-dependent oxidoreductase [Tropicibacter sp. R16_0]
MTGFSCVIIGNESLLIGCADALLDRGHQIKAVISTDPAIKSWAASKGLPQADELSSLTGQFQPGDFDWLLSIANLQIISDQILALPAKGAVNFHDGPLPRYAGLNTPVWALLNGETRYGVTWHMIESGIDTGDILARPEFDIADDETALSLNSKCYAAALDSFADVLTQLETGLTPTPQDTTDRRYFARDDRPEGGGALDLSGSAPQIAARVRALHFGEYWNPLLSPRVETGTRSVLVGQATPTGTTSGKAPGTVLEFDTGGLIVATGDGDLRLEQLHTPHGAPLQPSEIATVGDILSGLTPEQTEARTSAIGAALAAERHWRPTLQKMQPVQMPLAGDKTSGAWEAVRIAVPHGIDVRYAGVAALHWAQQGDGAETVTVALTDDALQSAATKAPGYVEPWVPVTLNAEFSVSNLAELVAQATETASNLGAFPSDLAARDPEIQNFTVPQIALSLDGAGPVSGTLATVSLSQGQATLHIDRTAVDARSVELLAQRLETAMEAVRAAAENTPLADISILSAAERAQVLTTWNSSAREYDRTETLHQAFEAQASRTPEATALVIDDQQLSYGQLNTRANSVAERLRAMGVGPGAHVGLYTDRSLDMVVGALAILKAGGAYVPLDPAYPADRIAHYITDSQASVLLSQSALASNLPASDADVLCIDTVQIDPQAQDVDGGATADDLAYLIYTSGSTGTPKGVMVEHRNVANFFAGMDDRIDHATGAVWLAVTSLNFDISVLELFWTLARGFKVVLTGNENRAVVSNGPIARSDRHIDFNLMYWGNDDGPGPKKYELLLEGAKFADAHGFNAVWTPERHFHAFGGPYPNPAVTGAAVAAVTKNLSVRAGSCVAPLHHPARIAEDWAVIDNLTGGRAAIGFASGWQPDDFILRPENTPPQNKPAMFEAIETVRKLWRGEAVGFPKADGSTHEVITQPRPVSDELPVWVTTAGNPETWIEAGRIGANVLTHLLGQSIDEVAEKIHLYRGALREAGHDPDAHRVTLMLHSYLADTREEAARIAREPMKDYLRSAAALIKQYAWAFPAFKKPKGVSNPFEMDLGQLTEDELEAILDFAFERYFEDSGLFGTIDDAVVRVESLKRIGVDEVACLIDYGIDPALVMEGLKPLAEVLKRANAPSTLAEDDYSLAAQIIRHDVTHLQCTPSMARIIAMNDEARVALGRVEHLLLGGEALPGDLVDDLRHCTKAEILNMYGPTETTIWSTCRTVPAQISGIVDIGAPIANTSVYVLDATGAPCPIGVPGELFIGGEGVTRGYWQRSELTDERFVVDPFAAEAGLTVTAAPLMYRTGDMVRWRADGTLDFLGRADHQIKIRGQRIELGEIENALTGFAGVRSSVVIAREHGGNTQLIGYITTDAPVSDAALRAHLAERLPEVMVPTHIMTLDAMPLTPNKKIDRKALPDPVPQRSATPAATSAPASGDVQTRIAAIWSRILGVADIRSDDNFFTLGGHSLLAVQAHREIRETLELPRLSITDIFRFPTLSGLSAHVQADKPAKETPVEDTAARADTMSKRRAMRAGRRMKTQ